MAHYHQYQRVYHSFDEVADLVEDRGSIKVARDSKFVGRRAMDHYGSDQLHVVHLVVNDSIIAEFYKTHIELPYSTTYFPQHRKNLVKRINQFTPIRLRLIRGSVYAFDEKISNLMPDNWSIDRRWSYMPRILMRYDEFGWGGQLRTKPYYQRPLRFMFNPEFAYHSRIVADFLDMFESNMLNGFSTNNPWVRGMELTEMNESLTEIVNTNKQWHACVKNKMVPYTLMSKIFGKTFWDVHFTFDDEGRVRIPNLSPTHGTIQQVKIMRRNIRETLLTQLESEDHNYGPCCYQ